MGRAIATTTPIVFAKKTLNDMFVEFR